MKSYEKITNLMSCSFEMAIRIKPDLWIEEYGSCAFPHQYWLPFKIYSMQKYEKTADLMGFSIQWGCSSKSLLLLENNKCVFKSKDL
jgi:hypothetical protein